MTFRFSSARVGAFTAIICSLATGPAFSAKTPVTTALKWSQCSVVHVTDVNNNLFEESLGSIYDLDEQGRPNADADAVVASVDLSTKSPTVQLGQTRWNLKNTDIDLEGQMLDTGGREDERVIEAKVKVGVDLLTFKLFTDKKVGRVTYKALRSNDDLLLAVFDCTIAKDPRNR